MEELIDFQEELNNPGYVFPMIEARTFVDHFLPPLKDGVDMKNIKSMLKNCGYIDSVGRWKRLWPVSGRRRRKKYDTFAPLFDIFQKATKCLLANACFILKDRASIGTGNAINSWADIALTAGFRKDGSDESCKKNARRIISNIQLAMVRDPSRRFSFGITVENTSLRLWFCSRASPVVSKSFDFSNDLDLLIHEQYRINVENLGNCDDDNASPTEIGIEDLGRATAQKFSSGFTDLHRDLSIGNLYLYGEHGLIRDLEYAKLKNTDIEHELLIGTPDFIAVEAADRTYGLLPRVDRVALDAELTAMEEGRWEDAALLRNSRRPLPFSHNDLHDLESLWWIAIWELFYHDEGLKSDAEHPYDKGRDEQRKLAAAELFPRSSETDDRRCFLQSGAYYCSSLAWMPDRLHNVKAALNALRKTFSEQTFFTGLTIRPNWFSKDAKNMQVIVGLYVVKKMARVDLCLVLKRDLKPFE
ncbi:hypothetical protein ACEPAI_2355 [Sanghuangporus weigelae]